MWTETIVCVSFLFRRCFMLFAVISVRGERTNTHTPYIKGKATAFLHCAYFDIFIIHVNRISWSFNEPNRTEPYVFIVYNRHGHTHSLILKNYYRLTAVADRKILVPCDYWLEKIVNSQSICLHSISSLFSPVNMLDTRNVKCYLDGWRYFRNSHAMQINGSIQLLEFHRPKRSQFSVQPKYAKMINLEMTTYGIKSVKRNNQSMKT